MIVRNVNPTKLHDELIAHGIVPISVKHDRRKGDFIAENTWITFADGTDMTVVQQVIDAHNPTPYPPTPTEIDYLIDLDYRVSLLELGIGGV